MAKSDKTRQFAELTPEQELALAALVEGVSDREAGERAGVSRQTVCGWRLHDPVFAARLNEARLALWAEHQDRLRAMIGAALDVLGDDLVSSDPAVQRAAAVAVLKSSGLGKLDLGAVGSIEPEKIALEWQSERVVSALDRVIAAW